MPSGLVSVAFTSTTFDDTPTYETVYSKTQAWDITRGRQSELDRIETGVATVTLVDASGLLDVLNALSSLAGELEPLKQIRLQEVNPVTSATVTQFTGLIEDWDYTADAAEAQLTIVLSCVDAFDVFANTEVVPDSTGQANYARQQVDDAQRARIADAGWPSALTQIATGNTYVKPVIYQAGTDILTTLHDCAEAEFPGIAIQFMSRLGLYTFHGRKIRFDPASYPTFVHVWNCGDAIGQAGNNDWAKIHDVSWRNAKNKIVNACLAAPEGIAAADVAGQLVTDPTSITERGTRFLKLDGLLTDGNVNTGSTDLEECLLFAQYYVDNYKVPLPQITKLVFKGGDPGDPTNAGTWALICGVELGDLINVVTVNPGGGGFNAGFYVERIHQVRLAGGERTLELDVSPQALYDTNPFDGSDT